MRSKARMRLIPGFTLLELIAVLVILGLLAVAAAMNMRSLIEDSHTAAAQSAIGVARSCLTQALATVMLDDEVEDTAANVKAEAERNKPGGDYEIEFSGPSGSGVITITATRDGHTATGTWTMP